MSATIPPAYDTDTACYTGVSGQKYELDLNIDQITIQTDVKCKHRDTYELEYVYETGAPWGDVCSTKSGCCIAMAQDIHDKNNPEDDEEDES